MIPSTNTPPEVQESIPKPDTSGKMETKARFKMKKRYLFYLADPLLILISAVALGVLFRLDVVEALIKAAPPYHVILDTVDARLCHIAKG